MGGKAADAPDYTPLANASKEAAEIGAQLGREQLTEAQRQYDQTAQFLKPILDSQLQLTQQGIQQGDEYYEYMKSFRPLEQQMLADAQAGTETANAAEREQMTQQALADAQQLKDRTAAYEQEASGDITLATGGNQAIADKYRQDIDADVGTAMADARAGQTQAVNTALRQAMRYGLSVPSNAVEQANQNALALAGAANSTRNNAIDQYRNIIAQGIGLKQNAFTTGQAATMDAMNMGSQALANNRNMRVQDQSLDWARQLDVAGMARGLSGASQGAYGLALNAGNAAAQNQMAPGQSLVNAMGQANATQMQGQGQKVQGLGSVLNAQTQYAVNSQDDGLGSILGGIGGAAAGLAKTGIFSDPALKENVRPVGRDARTGLTLYEFSYIGDPNHRYRGVMADEVKPLYPEAVSVRDGYMTVDYGVLDIEFKEVDHAQA